MDIQVIPAANAKLMAGADEIETVANGIRAQIDAIDNRIADLVDIKTKLMGVVRGYQTMSTAMRSVADPAFSPVYEPLPSVLTGGPRTGPAQPGENTPQEKAAA